MNDERGTSEPFEVDLWEIMACSYGSCLAPAGHVCQTSSGALRVKSHACRLVWVLQPAPVLVPQDEESRPG